jgi:hypothetical protein
MSFFETFLSSFSGYLLRIFSGYLLTEGLAQFPPDQQFAVWRAAHSQLKAEDSAYRARCRRHMVKIIVAGVVVFLMGQIGFWLREADVIPPEFRTAEKIIVFLVPLAVISVYLLIVMIRHMKWLNAKVAEEIRKRGPE